MIANIFKIVFQNFQKFIVTWIVVLLVNQIFIFHACFAPYCIIAALPHTSVIAALITFFMNQESKNSNSNINRYHESSEYLENRNTYNSAERSEELKKLSSNKFSAQDGQDMPTCPICGASMKRRTARYGPHAGQDFWGCSKYPNCKGIRNIDS